MKNLRTLLAFVTPRLTEVGRTQRIELPAHLEQLAGCGVLEAIRLSDGRIGMLVKTAIGWKGNFSGYLYLSEPAQQSEIIDSGKGRAYISLSAPPPWEELYIHTTRSDNLWEVFFDLN